VVLIEEALVEESHIGLDDGHLHAVADEFEAEGLGQAVDGVFRPGIHGESRFGIVALSRRTAHVNYPPSSGFEEREEGADGVDHADEVDVKLLLAVLPRLPLQLAADAVRRRVDQRPQT